MVVIRPIRPEDDAALAEICRLTGFVGKDSRPYFTDDELLPDLYLRPLVAADPGLAWAAVGGPEDGPDDGRPVGYVVATADTAGYVRWFQDAWLPRVGGRHPRGVHPPGSWDAVMTGLLHDPGHLVVPELAPYPAHLHMNVHPGHVRRGLGGRMLGELLAALRGRGVPGIHGAPSKYNIDSRQFYKRMGFTHVPVAGAGAVRFVARAL